MAKHGAGLETRVTEAPWRLRTALAAGKFAASRNVETIGFRRLRALYEDRPIVVATTHLTVIDMQLTAAVISQHRGVTVARASRIDHITKFPIAWTELQVAGKKHFPPIDGNRSKTARPPEPARFDPRNLDPFVEAARDGKAVLIAANRSTADERFGRPGIAIPYIAAATGAAILPVAVRVLGSAEAGMEGHAGRTLRERAPVEIIIGEPFEFAPLDMDDLDGRLDEDRSTHFSAARFLRRRGASVVERLQEMVELAEQQTIDRSPLFQGSVIGTDALF